MSGLMNSVESSDCNDRVEFYPSDTDKVPCLLMLPYVL